MPNAKNLQFLKDLMAAPSPSGYEEPAQRVVRDYLEPFADEIKSDRNGNLIALKKGSGKLKVMVVGHADEIGLIVNHIDAQGYLYVKGLGGFDVNLLPGLRLDIYHKAKSSEVSSAETDPYDAGRWGKSQNQNGRPLDRYRRKQ